MVIQVTECANLHIRYGYMVWDMFPQELAVHPGIYVFLSKKGG